MLFLFLEWRKMLAVKLGVGVSAVPPTGYFAMSIDDPIVFNMLRRRAVKRENLPQMPVTRFKNNSNLLLNQ